jgi:hypothetical protein
VISDSYAAIKVATGERLSGGPGGCPQGRSFGYRKAFGAVGTDGEDGNAKGVALDGLRSSGWLYKGRPQRVGDCGSARGLAPFQAKAIAAVIRPRW